MELNKENLEKALGQLPTYSPPTHIWDGIEEELTAHQADQVISASIKQLPQYQPAPEIWAHIEENLQETPAKIKRLPTRRRWMNIAASIAVLIFSGTIGWLIMNQNNETIKYLEEEVVVKIMSLDWDADKEAIELLMVEFEESPVAQQHQHYDQWKIEMDELFEARIEVVEAIELYGEDENLLKELNRIDDSITDLGLKMYKLI